MDLVPKVITRPAGRFGAVAQNALEVARFGGLETGQDHSPFDVVAEHRVYRLRHYFPETEADGRPAVVLVPPMMLSAEVWDVAPAATAVGSLHEHGVDPWVVDFGEPEREAGGLERTLTDHVVAVSDAVDRVRTATGRDVHLAGYSQGGMFCYQTAAYRRSEGVASVVAFGSPADLSIAMPLGLPQNVASRGATFIADRILGGRALPAWASSAGFRLLDPVKSLRSRIDFLMQLHDREALLPRERQRRFLAGEGFVAWPGPALAEFMHQFVAHNRMLSGGFVIEDQLVTLADISCPILYFVGEVDEIAPAPAVRAIQRAAPRADVYEVALRAGHFGLVVGSAANRTTWPVVADWARWVEEQGEFPHTVTKPLEDAESDGLAVRSRMGYGVELAATVGASMARAVAATATNSVRTARELTREAAGQLPRLARLEQITPSTRISLGLVLDEQAKRGPDEILFLFEDRAHTRTAAKARIDAVVRGLISLGVRQGEHVGVLMSNRPSSLAVVAALSRIGAVAVLIRPDGDVAREAELGQVTRIVADPERVDLARGLAECHTFVLGGGAQERDLGPDVIDMERIDPDGVELPAWYRPNPGRASDLAFILFSGEGTGTKVNRITNRRFALSAFGTASSAALSRSDTVYSVAPLYHPSGLLMTTGGALAGDARIAMTTEYDPDRFWEEVRRYGVTVASYTWTGLRPLVNAPPNPGERHHPIRLFIGSGMPRGLWRRVEDRFAPARVLEFWASTEGDAILVNLSGAKPGAMGRPLPGSAEVRIARYDAEQEHLVTGPDGLAIECEAGQAGMLLARARPGPTLSSAMLRGVFEREDAWLVTGDLFERDGDGDFWLVSGVGALIRTRDGLVPPLPVRDALESVPAVDLAVPYGIPAKEEGTELVVAAVTLRDGRELEPSDINAALALLDPGDRPAVVHVVADIPTTTWHRPITGPLRKAGLPEAGSKQAWYRDPAKDTYRPLTAAARRRLVG